MNYSTCLRLIGKLYSIIILLCFPALLYAQSKQWSLNACVEKALRENVALNQGEANNEINAINYQQAKANVLPDLNISDIHALNNGRFISPVTNQYINQSASNNTLSLTGNITLYNGFKNINLIKENRLNYLAGEMDVEKMRNDLMLNIIAVYMQILFEYEAVAISQTIIENDMSHVDYTRKYVDAGSLPQSDLLQVQAQLSTDRASKVNAENQLLLAKVTLMQLMEMPISNDFEIERPAAEEIIPDITINSEAVYKIAQSFLPEVKSASMRTSAAGFALKISRAEIMPRLILSGSLNTAYSSANTLRSYSNNSRIENIGYLQGDPSALVYGPVTTTTVNSSSYPFLRQFDDNFGQGVSLNLVIPIFNNLLYRSDIRRAVVTMKVAELNEHAVKNQLRKNVEQAYADQLTASKNFIATQEELLAEQRSYHDVEIKFKAGTINATDFFVEKNNYNKAVFSHLSAKYDYLFKTKIIAFYTGLPITQ